MRNDDKPVRVQEPSLHSTQQLQNAADTAKRDAFIKLAAHRILERTRTSDEFESWWTSQGSEYLTSHLGSSSRVSTRATSD
jgi:hypothetical protein